MSWTTSPGDLEQALARYGPLTDVWEVVTVPSSTTLTVSLVQPKGVVPVLGSALAALYTDALAVFVTGALSGAPAVAASPGRFGTTVASVTSAAGPPPVTTLTLADALPATPHAGDQLVVIRNLGVGQALDANIQNAQLDANVINDYIAANGLIQSQVATLTVSNLSAGATTVFDGALLWALGWYSMATIWAVSANGNSYTVSLNMNASVSSGILENNYTNTAQSPTWSVDGSSVGTFDRWKFPAVPLNRSDVNVTNTGTGTVSSDTITIVALLQPASVEVENAATSPVNAAAPPLDMADASGSITTGGTSQQVLASASSRRYLLIVNATSNSDTLWVNFGSAASAGAGSIPLAPGFALEYPAGQYVPSNTVNLVAATTGDAYTVKYA